MVRVMPASENLKVGFCLCSNAKDEANPQLAPD
jgi:hypothetical protein